MSILIFQMDEVCVLPDRFISSSKRTCLLSLYIILPGFIKIGRELFEIIEVQTHTHTHTQTCEVTRKKFGNVDNYFGGHLEFFEDFHPSFIFLKSQKVYETISILFF